MPGAVLRLSAPRGRCVRSPGRDRDLSAWRWLRHPEALSAAVLLIAADAPRFDRLAAIAPYVGLEAEAMALERGV